MPRKRLSEFRAKSILYKALDEPYSGWEFNSEEDWQANLDALPDNQNYVVKVDQAEKGRFKKGLVKLNRNKSEATSDLDELFNAGYQFALVEPYETHEDSEERYFSLERTRDGIKVSYSPSGGINVEENSDSITHEVFTGEPLSGIDVDTKSLSSLVDAFQSNYFSFLEINPLVIKDEKLYLLDAAVEVDNEAEFFEENWKASDLRRPKSKAESPEELSVQELASKSQASFSLEVINPNGRIFVLLSGGGASVVVADEVYNLGSGKELGNYGEYSGNPNLEETEIYTEQVVKLLLKSSANSKVLIIGGGVANFTDVRITFKGVVNAIKKHEEELRNQGVKVYVRRGGPHEKEGLEAIKSYLEKANIA